MCKIQFIVNWFEDLQSHVILEPFVVAFSKIINDNIPDKFCDIFAFYLKSILLCVETKKTCSKWAVRCINIWLYLVVNSIGN